MGGSIEKGKLTTKEYTDFLDGFNREALTVDQLNHIIFMNGFIRMHRRHKMDILEVLKSMDLVDLRRSTLKEKVRPCPALSVEEVRAALEAMGRKEGAVVTVESIGKGEVSDPGRSQLVAVGIGSSSTAAASSACGPTVKKRKRGPRGRPPTKGKMKYLADVPFLASIPPPGSEK